MKKESTQTRSVDQQQIVNELTRRFSIDGERILFLNAKDPLDAWIPPSELESIARQTGEVQSTDVEFVMYVEPLQQIHYRATVVDKAGRIFARPGAAKIGEQSKGGDEIEAETLAQGRALSHALRAAGFHPLKSGSVVALDERRAVRQSQPLTEEQQTNQIAHDAASLRTKDLKQIHAIAERKGLILPMPGGKDDSGYRNWLWRKFGVGTAAKLDAFKRAQVIAEIDNYEGEEDELEMIA